MKIQIDRWIKLYRLLCYRSLKEHLFQLKVSEKLKILNKYLLESKLEYILEEYLAVAIITSFLISIIFSYLISSVLYYILNLSKLIMILFFLVGIIVYFIIFLSMFILYIIYKRNTLKKEIEKFLPDVVLHLSTLSTAGLPYFKMFKIIGYLDEYGELSKVFKRISTNTEIYGMDFIKAVEIEANTSPSPKLKEIFYDIIATITTGGNLTNLLINKSNTLSREKEQQEKNYAETLSIIAEMYITVLIAGPLIAITMLSIIGLISNLPIRYDVLLTIIVYLGVPIAYLMFFILLSMD